MSRGTLAADWLTRTGAEAGGGAPDGRPRPLAGARALSAVEGGGAAPVNLVLGDLSLSRCGEVGAVADDVDDDDAPLALWTNAAALAGGAEGGRGIATAPSSSSAASWPLRAGSLHSLSNETRGPGGDAAGGAWPRAERLRAAVAAALAEHATAAKTNDGADGSKDTQSKRRLLSLHEALLTAMSDPGPASPPEPPGASCAAPVPTAWSAAPIFVYPRPHPAGPDAASEATAGWLERPSAARGAQSTRPEPPPLFGTVSQTVLTVGAPDPGTGYAPATVTERSLSLSTRSFSPEVGEGLPERRGWTERRADFLVRVGGAARRGAGGGASGEGAGAR